MVMELASNGSLQHLLRLQRTGHYSDVTDDVMETVTSQHRKLTSSDLVLFGVHVASGMEYIASQRVKSCLHFTPLYAL